MSRRRVTQGASFERPPMEKKPAASYAVIAIVLILLLSDFLLPNADTKPDALTEEQMEEFVKQDVIDVNAVQIFYLGRGKELTEVQAQSLVSKAKAHLVMRQKKMGGDYILVFPGAHFPRGRAMEMAKRSEVAKKVFFSNERQLAPILKIDGKPLTNKAGEVILAAKPVADLLTKVNREAYKRYKQELDISYCFRSDARQAIAWAGIHGYGPVSPAAESVHQTGLACDFNNGEVVEELLVEIGMIGGCSGIMYGSDFGHFSFGEMEQRGKIRVAACRKSSYGSKKLQEKAGRGIRKIKRVGRKVKEKWRNWRNKRKRK